MNMGVMSSSSIEVEKPNESQQKSQENQEQHFHVLAVDDSVLDRMVLEKLLKVSSYKVTCVDSGDEALKYLGLVDDDVDKNYPGPASSSNSSSSSSSSSPHSPPQEESKVNLIMTDYCMPGMSGYDLLKRLKGSSWKNVPVVIMSSEEVPSRISECLEGGAEEFLLKPLQLSDLKNLEHYLLKPVIDHSCESNIINNIEDNFTQNDNVSNDNDDVNKSNANVGKTKGDTNSGTNIMSKRKANMSPSPTDQRRPKVKGQAVV